jgi:hypothetical protein
MKDLQLLNSGRMLGIRHDEGMCFWELNVACVHKRFDFSLENSNIFITKDKQRVMMGKNNKEVYELALPNLNVKKRVQLPDFVHQIFYLPNGDLVLYLQKEERRQINFKLKLAAKLKKNLFQKRKKRENESDDEEGVNTQEESQIKHLLMFMHWRSQVDLSMDQYGSLDLSQQDLSKTLPILFESNYPITSFRVSSNLDGNNSTMISPRDTFGFNSDIFSEDNPNMDNNTLCMYVGTNNQQCFLLNVEISQFGEIYDQQIKEHFHDRMVTTESQQDISNENNLAQKMLAHIDSVISEPDQIESESNENDNFDQDNVFSEEPQAVHDFGNIFYADVMFRVVCMTNVMTDNVVCMVSSKYGRVAMEDCLIPLGVTETFMEGKLFKLQLMTNLVGKANIREFKAFIFNDIGIALLDFSMIGNRVKCVKFLRKEIDLEVGLCYSQSKEAFYMSNGKNLQVWDHTLNYSLYNIDTSDHIFKIILLEKQNILAVYDSEHYKEISTENLECLNREKAENENVIFLNHSLLESCLLLKTSRFIDTFRLGVILFCEPLSLTNFPFVSLQSCFRDEDYENPILSLAQYYFHRLGDLENVDEIYGPINPMILSIYHNDTKLLETLLNMYFYPYSFRNYWSPLEYAFRQGYQSAIKVICDCLVKRDHPVQFSKQDFHFLLESSVSYCHKLVATIPEPCQNKSVPRLVYMNSNVQLLYCNDISHLLTKIRKQEKVTLTRKSTRRILRR